MSGLDTWEAILTVPSVLHENSTHDMQLACDPKFWSHQDCPSYTAIPVTYHHIHETLSMHECEGKELILEVMEESSAMMYVDIAYSLRAWQEIVIHALLCFASRLHGLASKQVAWALIEFLIANVTFLVSTSDR